MTTLSVVRARVLPLRNLVLRARVATYSFPLNKLCRCWIGGRVNSLKDLHSDETGRGHEWHSEGQMRVKDIIFHSSAEKRSVGGGSRAGRGGVRDFEVHAGTCLLSTWANAIILLQ